MSKAENKTKATKASVSGYIAALPDAAKQADAKILVKMMQTATGERPAMWGPSIIGFGSVHYVYDSGREGDMPLIGFSPRKPALVIYGVARTSEALLAKLGKYTTGKGCLYIKRLSDVDVKVLEKMIVFAVRAKAKMPKTK
jgi:hypothetical protein